MLSTINKKLIPMKGHYFLWNAGTGPVVPFLSTYAKQLGFSSSTVGVMYTVMPFMGMLAKPLFGAIADRYRCQKIIFLAFILVTAGAFLATFYSPTIEPERKIHFSCDNSITALDTCVNNVTVSDCTEEILQTHFDNNITRCH
ncbi:membrane transporter, partial [Oryctes borbonicus]